MARKWNSAERLLMASFAGVVASFVLATAYSQYRESAIDTSAVSIAAQAAPRIRHLADVRLDLQQIPILVAAWRSAADAKTARDELLASRRHIQSEFAAYAALSSGPLDVEQSRLLGVLLTDVDARVAGILASDSSVNDTARGQTLRETTIRAATSVLAAIDLEAGRAHDAAMRIERIRTRSTRWAYLLDAAAALLTIVAAAVVVRTLRFHRRLEEAHSQLLAERAEEMEQFSGRVAHDILNPLGAVGLSLAVAMRDGASNDRLRALLTRGEASLARAKHIVEALLDFARSGAHPSADARCSVSDCLRGLRDELSGSAAAAGVHLSVSSAEAWVRCDVGVLLSVLENLVWNAIKYIGNGPVQRVAVSAAQEGRFVRFEVTDTGPGLPPGFEGRLFKPFARGPHPDLPGVGLGLATVKRSLRSR